MHFIRCFFYALDRVVVVRLGVRKSETRGYTVVERYRKPVNNRSARLKILIVAIFVAVTVAVGVFAPKHSTVSMALCSVDANVGPWLSAFAFGTQRRPYLSAVVFIGYAGQFGSNTACRYFGSVSVMRSSVRFWRGGCSAAYARDDATAQGYDHAGILRQRYNSRALRIAAAAIIFVFLIPYTASVSTVFRVRSAWLSAAV